MQLQERLCSGSSEQETRRLFPGEIVYGDEYRVVAKVDETLQVYTDRQVAEQCAEVKQCIINPVTTQQTAIQAGIGWRDFVTGVKKWKEEN